MSTPALSIPATSLADYPPQGHALAIAHLQLLQTLPRIFAAVLLRELIAYDWKFPDERMRVEDQLRLLEHVSAAERTERMAQFAACRLSKELEAVDWIADPSGFMEQLTAWLWSSGQMDAFRVAAETYAAWLNQQVPTAEPAMRRLALISIGRGTQKAEFPLFRKLRAHGLYLNNIKSQDGWATLHDEALSRARSAGTPFRHWYIDGGSPESSPHLTQVSYESLLQPRAQLLAKIQQAIDSGNMGPEKLRSTIARLDPHEIGLASPGSDATLDRFKLSLLTEGSGTQIFSTTFVQWAARECLRRAQPETLLMRYAPRQQFQPMNVMLSPGQQAPVDANGSLVDADMGAYYTWINMRRLTGADKTSFLIWYEGSSQALAIGPGLPTGTTSDSPLSMPRVLALVA